MFRVFLVTPANVNIWLHLALQIMARRLGVFVKRLRKPKSAASCLSVRFHGITKTPIGPLYVKLHIWQCQWNMPAYSDFGYNRTWTTGTLRHDQLTFITTPRRWFYSQLRQNVFFVGYQLGQNSSRHEVTIEHYRLQISLTKSRRFVKVEISKMIDMRRRIL
jgi:hypothetical protein